jgi:hypothetical protein
MLGLAAPQSPSATQLALDEFSLWGFYVRGTTIVLTFSASHAHLRTRISVETLNLIACEIFFCARFDQPWDRTSRRLPTVDRKSGSRLNRREWTRSADGDLAASAIGGEPAETAPPGCRKDLSEEFASRRV